MELFNIFGHVFCVAVLFIVQSGKKVYSNVRQSRKFQTLVLSDVIYLILNIIWQILESNNESYSYYMLVAFYILLVISHSVVGVSYYRYLHFVIRQKRARYPLIWVVACMYVITVITSLNTHWLFMPDENGYFIFTEGYPFNLLLSNFYLLITTAFALECQFIRKDKVLRERAKVAYAFLLPSIAFVLLHLFLPEWNFLDSLGVTISILSIFETVQKKFIDTNLKQSELARENAALYRSVALSNALQFMVVNLSTNKIDEFYIPQKPDLTLHDFISKGYINSNDYSDVVRVWCKGIVDVDDAELQNMYSSTELLKSFENGKTRINHTFKSQKRNGDFAWCDQEILLAKKESSNDVIATITIFDITRQKNQEKIGIIQSAVVEGLAYGYLAYFIFDIDTEAIIDVSFDGEEEYKLMQKYSFTDNYTDFIAALYDRLTGDDVGSIADAISIDTVRQKLSEKKQYIIPVSSFFHNRNAHFQIAYTSLDLMGTNAFILSIRDITENVEKEHMLQQELSVALKNAEKANAAKSLFLFNISHDIRTPMNAILGFNELAYKHIEDKSKALNALKKARYAGEHMLGIINDILDFASIENGKMQLHISSFNLSERFAQFRDMFSLEMEKKGITFVFKDEFKSKYVLGDNMRISQIITNFLSNAMKFTKEGGTVTLCGVEHECQNEEETLIEIRVKDTGIGMSEEFQKNMFKSFEREKSATLSGVQGTGLGLAIAKNLSDLMDGKIEFTSVLGEGTEFIFSVKLVKAIEPEYVAQPETINLPDPAGKKILVVEDNELNREIVCDILEEKGFVITCAEDGAQAVEIVQMASDDAFDVVLMDVQMPVMDGYTATKIIRALDNTAKAKLPIIAMTANAFEEDRLQALSIGMNEHITKPIDASKMIEMILSCL